MRAGPARRVGVLALQGGFAPHARAIRTLGHEAIEVRAAPDAIGLDALVLPGGESTAIRDLLARDGGALERALHALHARGTPILATCAGAILAAREVRAPAAPSLGWIDVAIARNAYGRQVASRVARDDGDRLDLVLIRAPRIVEVGPGVEVLATLGGSPVLVRDRNVVAATFHPELTEDLSVHRLALGAARAHDGAAASAP